LCSSCRIVISGGKVKGFLGVKVVKGVWSIDATWTSL
jgi:hypothetical protein